MPNPIARSIAQQAQNVLVTGQRFKRFDQVRQRHFWSTYRMTPDDNGFIAPGDFDIFQIPVGQTGQGFGVQLTLLETNWPGTNRVADNQNLEVTELGVSCKTRQASSVVPDPAASPMLWNSPNYAGAENEILRNTVLGITYLTNTVPLGMCTDFAQASGPRVGQYAPFSNDRLDITEQSEIADATGYPSVSNVEATGRNLVTNGFAGPSLRRKFTIPILLQHGETFRFTLSIPPGRNPFVWKMYGDVNGANIYKTVFDIRVDFWATESFVEKG